MGITNGRARVAMNPPPASNRDIAFYGCSEISLYGPEISYFLSYIPILNAGPSEKFLFMDHLKKDHNVREFKP